jgi:hypothetical protein
LNDARPHAKSRMLTFELSADVSKEPCSAKSGDRTLAAPPCSHSHNLTLPLDRGGMLPRMNWDTIFAITGMICGLMWAVNRRKSQP